MINMFEEERALNALKAEFPNLEVKFLASRSAATLNIDALTRVIIDPEKDLPDWIILDLTKGVITPSVKSKMERNDKLLLLTIYESLQRYYQAELNITAKKHEERQRERAEEFQAWKNQATKVNVSKFM